MTIQHKSLSKKRKILIIVITILLLATLSITGVYLLTRGGLINRNNSTQQYEVKFISDDGTILKIDTVNEHLSAEPPKTPLVSYGNIFSKWDSDFTDISDNLTVTALCENTGNRKNVFALPGAYGTKCETVYLSLSLCGDVSICGFEMSVTYDSQKLELTKTGQEDGAVIYNDSIPGEIYLNYVSTENTTGDVDLCQISFTILCDEGTIPIAVNVINAYTAENDGTLSKCETNTICSNIYVLPSKAE